MINNNIVLTITFVITGFFTSIAQQTPVYSEYAHNSILLNPAHAGYNIGTDITLSNRSFVNGLDGLPSTSSLTVNTATRNRNIGFGFSAINDQIGVTQTTGLTASFGYKLIFDIHPNRAQWWDYNPNTLTFGISAGAVWYQEDLVSLEIQNDPSFAENINSVVPTVGIGILYNRNQFYVGLSNTNIIGSALASNDNINLESPSYIYGGYKIYTTRFQKIQIKPNFLLKYVSNVPFQADFNVSLNYKNKIEFGAGYRTNSSVNLLAVLRSEKNFKTLFSYNFPVSSNPLGSTIGILLSYRFNTDIRRR